MGGSTVQSGNVTPSHLAIWLGDGVLGDGGPGNGQYILASLRGANFNTTNDQPIVIPQRIIAFRLQTIIVTNATVSLTTAVGGFYPAASKGGTPIIAASQVYSGLTTQDSLIQPTLAAFGSGTRFSARTLGQIVGLSAIWLSLTTGQGVAATADVYLAGQDLT